MFKTFVAGILLGAAGAAAALYFVPVVDQYREQSLIVVQPNLGNTESFHANVPMDRIMVGTPGQENPLPAGLSWPDDPKFAGLRAELFKIRNGKDAVIGIASRIAASDAESGDIIEWVVHLPARGSIYVTMRPEVQEGGFRVGSLMAGTREFSALEGSAMERWIADSKSTDGAAAGRIELTTAFMAAEAGR